MIKATSQKERLINLFQLRYNEDNFKALLNEERKRFWRVM